MRKPLLKPFNRSFRIRSRGRLPHWELDDAVYAITYRLSDSLPEHILRSLEAERLTLVRRMSSNGRAMTPDERSRFDEEFSLRLDQELDRGYGSCLLKNGEVARMIIGNWFHFDEDRYRMIAWCVMPNHVHLVVHIFVGSMLDRIFHSWKSYSSHKANEILNREGTVWQREFFDRIVRDREDLTRSVEYVLNNPRNTGLKQWPWLGVREDRFADLL